ncbi:MAG: AsmA family protein [Candidatus Omnitrophica bacterium]|nr:AsmA family protein [Candidatus Omnitrophota bacterium]
MKNILTPIIAIIIVIIVVFAIGKNLILKAAIEGGGKAATGLSLTMDSINLDFGKTSLEIKNMRLFNPKGFPDKIMCEIPEIYLSLKLGELFKGTVHVPKMTLDLKELTVEKNAEGETNVNSLKPVQKQKEEKAETAKEKKKGEAPKLLIDELNLKVGKVIYKDFTATPPTVKEYNVNLDENYKDIKDPGALVSLILVKALMKTSISELTNLDLSDLKSSLKNQFVSNETFKTKAEEMARDAASKIKSLF